MSISDKEAALKLIEGLPDDATPAEISEAVAAWQHESRRGAARPGSNGTPRPSAAASDADEPVTFHLERQGRFTVLVPDQPVPPLTVEMVNDLIEEMRRERAEHIWGGPLPDDAGR